MNEKKPLTIHLISHNHWDREWIFTARYANTWLPTFFQNLFDRLETQPEYRFVLDGQTRIIEDYLTLLPGNEAAARERDLRKYAKRGQLMVGPAYLQPDWSLVSGEALVRNLLIGRKTASKYGQPMNAAWLLDNFGQIAQAPQILKGFGIEGAFVWRGIDMPMDQLTTEFWWEAPDGTRLLGVYLLDSYRNAMVLNMTRPFAKERILTHAQTLARFAATPNVLLMNGYEQVPQPDDVLPILEEFNQAGIADKVCVQSTPPEYLAAVRAQAPELPTVRGYQYSGRLAPILKGVFSSRNPLKQQNNECQRELERWAEKFNTLAWAFGFDYPEDRFEQAWKTLLLNHTHDDVCGCCIDPIARDMEARFTEVHRMASIMSTESLLALAQSIDTSSREGLAILVFNPSSRARQEVVPISIDLPEEMETFCIQDSAGQVHPYQLINRIGRKLDLYLWGDRVPSVGYKTYYIKPGACPINTPYPQVTVSAEKHQMENQYLKVQINLDGTLTIHDKQQNDTYPHLGYFEDGGDSGDTYDYSHPARNTVFTTLGRPAHITVEATGPLLARFRLETHLDLPVALTPDRQSRAEETRRVKIISFVELSANAGHIEIRTHVHNVVKDHRLRVLFPTKIKTDHATAGMPFDIATFPLQDPTYEAQVPARLDGLMLAGRYTAPVNTYPFRHFVSLDDQKSSLTIFSHGLMEYEVLPEDHTIALTLLRGVGWLARNDLLTRVGDVGPHIFTPEAQCLGVQTFEYAIYPHGGNLHKANPIYESDRHTLSFRAVQTNTHPGRLPDEFSFFSWVGEKPQRAFKLSALKKAEDGEGLILRLFNKLDQPARGQLKIGGQVTKAWQTNLNEDPQTELHVEDGTIHFKARPKEIITLRIHLKPWRLIDDYQVYASRVLPSPIDDLALEEIFKEETPPVITQEEVAAEQARAQTLQEQLHRIRSQAYILSEELNTETNPPLDRLTELHRLKGEEATLSRQSYEARISALLNQHLLITRQMESELSDMGEGLNLARVRKRVGEFALHYYESLK